MQSKQPALSSASQIRSAIDRLLDELAKKVVEDCVAEQNSQERRPQESINSAKSEHPAPE